MNARPAFASRLLVAAVLALALAAPAPALAQCTYLSPPAWQTIGLPGTVGIGQIPGSAIKSSWTVAAVRPLAGEDWDLQLYPATGASPTCVSGTVLASSTYGGSIVDFVVGDGTTNAHTDVYPRWYQFSGSGPARAAWTDSAITLVPEQTFWWTWFQPDTLVHVYQFNLTAGVSYQIDFDQSANSGGTMGATAHLFRNPGTGTFWTGRGGALASLTGPATYTAPATDTYALVVCNDARAAGYYALKVWSCQAPVALAPRTYTPLTGVAPAFSCAPGTARWGVIGFYGYGYGPPELFGTHPTGGAAPNCYTDHRLWLDDSYDIYSYDGYQLGVVNFDEAGSQPFYLPLEQTTSFGSYSNFRYVTWDPGRTTLAVDGPQVTGWLGMGNPGNAYDVNLVAGVTYHVYFTVDLDEEFAVPYLLLFRPQGGGFYNTGSAVLKLMGAGHYTFTAPATGTYGVVVTGPTDYGSGPYAVAFASASCPFPTLLTEGVNASLPPTYAFTQFDSMEEWNLFAVRGAAGEDWDLVVSDSPTGSAPPGCIGPTLGFSNYGSSALDFVVTHQSRNYFDDPPAHWYARANHIGAGGANATMVAMNPRRLADNDPVVVDTVTASELAHFYTLYLSSGVPYHFEFTRLTTGVTVHLLGPDAYGAPLGFGRPTAVVSAASSFTYTPSTGGTYALVVANDNLAGGGYQLRFGACETPYGLYADTPYRVYSGMQVYAVPQTQAAWSAYGVRYGATDWDLAAAPGSSTTWPSCLSGSGAISSLATTNYTDIVVADFHHVTPATWYAKPYQFAPAPLDEPWAEWSPATSVTPNELYGPTWTMTANDVLRCHEVRLTAGVTYTIAFAHDGTANLRLLVYRNPGTGAYWAGRSAAVISLAPGTQTTYTAPATDDYAIVVVDDSGQADTYRFMVTYCASPVALTNGTPVTVEPVGFASFTPGGYFWNAVGVRGPGDWDLGTYGSASGGVSGVCFSTQLGGSTGVGFADFVVGDFNSGANPLGTYYARPYRLDPTGPGTLEWASGTSVLAPGAAPATRTTGANDVLEIWDANLIAGQPYNVYFTHTGDAAVRALIFSNPGGAYWAPRSGAVWQGTGHGTFVPTRSGWHGVVVVNDNGLAGGYQIGFSQGGVGAEPQSPSVTALRGAAPNPVRGETTIEYALRDGASVRLEVLDMAGRRVATLEDGERAAGTYRVPWARAGGVAPGLYFVRLQVAGRTIGEKKVAIVQ